MTALRKTSVAALVGAAAVLAYPMAVSYPFSTAGVDSAYGIKEVQRKHDNLLPWPSSVSFQTINVEHDESPDTEHWAKRIHNTVTTITQQALNLVGTANAAPR